MLRGEPPGPHRIERVRIGYTPPLWDPSVVDDIEPVSTAEAKDMARRLAREEAVFAGTSSGANVVAALRVAARLGPGDGGRARGRFRPQVPQHRRLPQWEVMGRTLLLGLLALASTAGNSSTPARPVPREGRMVMTVLEARVPADRLGEVEHVFGEGMSPLPPEIV